MRDQRNKFIHRGQDPTKDSARAALNVLVELLASALSSTGVDFDRENLDKYLTNKTESRSDGLVGKAGDIDWSQVQYWKEVPAIPGDEKWEGDFERFEDITLQPIKPVLRDG